MAVEILHDLPEISWTKNPMKLEFESNLAIEQLGQIFVGYLGFENSSLPEWIPPAIGSSFTMQLYDVTLTFIFVENARLGFDELPIYNGIESLNSWFLSVADFMMSNSFINNYYTIDIVPSIDYGGFGLIIQDASPYLQFTAKEESDKSNIVLAESSLRTVFSVTSEGRSLLYRKNLNIYAELWVYENSGERRLISTSIVTDKSGRASWDISIPLHNYAEKNIESLSPDSGVVMYYLNYFDVYGNNQVVGNYQKTVDKYALWGGVPKSRIGEHVGDSLFQNGLLKFLEPQIRTRADVILGQEYELTFFNPNSVFADVKVCANLMFANDIEVEIVLDSVYIGAKTKMYINAMRSEIFETYPEETLIGWEIYLKSADIISEKYAFKIDTNIHPYTKFMKYRNSYGSFSYMNLYGKGNVKYDIEQDRVSILGNAGTAVKKDIDIVLENKETLRSGYKSKSEIERFRDFFLSRDKYLKVGDTWQPVVVSTSEILESEDGNQLYAIQFDVEWTDSSQVWGYN